MILFDVESLFTNVPVDMTIKIILRKTYQERMLDIRIPQKEMGKYSTYANNMFILAMSGKYTHNLME